MIEDRIRKKIQELIDRGNTLANEEQGDRSHVALCVGWITEALNVTELAIPQPTNAYRVRLEATSRTGSTNVFRVDAMTATFRGLLRDIDAGLLNNFANKIRAETFDEFLEHAEWYHAHDRKNEAGVLAGVVFEDTVRRICRDQAIDEKGEKLEELINQLAKKDVITGQQSKQAKVAAHVRTKATHAQWDEFDLDGVASAIKITRIFLAEQLGG